MTDLTKQKCEACTANSPRLGPEEIARLQLQILDWQVVEREGELRLKKVYQFPDFRKAMAFTNAVGEEAEREGHHPALLTEWGKVTVSWWTHAIFGLHLNDFIMAAKTDGIYKQSYNDL